MWLAAEDTVLAAAVRRYGTNQWERVALLLLRKLARMAKERWVEVLLPAAAPAAWSRDDDVRLGELVRAMPNQWRTISEAVGRTAQQCVERWAVLQGGVAAAAEEEDTDPLHLEDDAEMVADARARLGSDLLKKVKRRAREKMLEEAKRALLVQLRRDGALARLKVKKRYAGEIDYGVEVPHAVAVPAGPHDVHGEVVAGEAARAEYERDLGRGSAVPETKPKRQRTGVAVPAQPAQLVERQALVLGERTRGHESRQAVRRRDIDFGGLPRPQNEYQVEAVVDAEEEAEHEAESEHQGAAPMPGSLPLLVPFYSLASRKNLPVPTLRPTPRNEIDTEVLALVEADAGGTPLPGLLPAAWSTVQAQFEAEIRDMPLLLPAPPLLPVPLLLAETLAEYTATTTLLSATTRERLQTHYAAQLARLAEANTSVRHAHARARELQSQLAVARQAQAAEAQAQATATASLAHAAAAAHATAAATSDRLAMARLGTL